MPHFWNWKYIAKKREDDKTWQGQLYWYRPTSVICQVSLNTQALGWLKAIFGFRQKCVDGTLRNTLDKDSG